MKPIVLTQTGIERLTNTGSLIDIIDLCTITKRLQRDNKASSYQTL